MTDETPESYIKEINFYSNNTGDFLFCIKEAWGDRLPDWRTEIWHNDVQYRVNRDKFIYVGNRLHRVDYYISKVPEVDADD